MEPVYFPSSGAFGAWLAGHHATEQEVIVGYWRVGTGRPSMTWSESVDEALRFGWIDGVRHRVDDERYTIRFTPRRPGSHWSRVNVEKAEALIRSGRMEGAGLAAYRARDPDNTAHAAHERDYELDPALQARLEADEAAWASFLAQPPGYRRTAVGWVMQAKRQDTRERRLASLMEHARAGDRIPQLTSPGKRGGRSGSAGLDDGLRALLDADEAANTFFRQQAPGIQRRSIEYVMAAKQPGTRRRRMEGMLEKARRGERWW